VKRITVVEMLKKLGRDIGTSTRWTIIQDISRLGVRTMTNTRAREITETGLLVEREGKETLLSAETIVLATGAKSLSALFETIKDRVPEVHLIGDAKTPRKALEAVAEGFEVGRSV